MRLAIAVGSVLLGLYLLLGRAAFAWSAEPCAPVVGRLASVQGIVDVQRSGGMHWHRARLNEVVCQGDSVRAGVHSRAELALVNEAVLRLDQNSVVRLTDIVKPIKKRSFFSLVKGALQSFSRHPRHFTINTPYLNGTIQGTEFVFRVADHRTTLTVFEGIVKASNPQGSVEVTRGHAAVARQGQAPQLRTVVHPRNASEWAMYYPPVVALNGASAPSFAALQSVPLDQRHAEFYLKRAALLLSVGQVSAARKDIDRALSMNPKAGLAYALRAVIEVVANQRTAALADARHGVTLDPKLAATHIALSYALQSQFKIHGARDTMLAATAAQPRDALAWSRLAELELMLGNNGQALLNAHKAAAINPHLARTETTLGFAALADFHIHEARGAFRKAIVLESSDPLPHFGLGLSEIKLGHVKQGTSDIEVAVGLDGRSALLRAYLGKAYFAEKREPLDAQQFHFAEQLDPLDPTAYLYDGILKQTQNDPVGAMHDVQRSIELNGNRAVYRSRLLLDKDRAARGTSLSRVYRDLGFTQLGVNEAAQSLALDPANASAHRFLSDTYEGVRRRGIARLSDLLQAQMLQSVNIDPLQPSISQANLNIVTLGGPANAGFNEFTPLFDTNHAKIDMAGFGGTQGTRSNELVASALYGRYSLSAGAFSYQTDGWRPNNALDEHVQNAFAQVAVTDALNVQAAFQHATSTSGDLAFNFDPNNFSANETNVSSQSTARFGLRYSPAANSSFLFSYIHNRSSYGANGVDYAPFEPPSGMPPSLVALLSGSINTIPYQNAIDYNGDQVEAQYILEHRRNNFVVGAALNDTTVNKDTSSSITNSVLGALAAPTTNTEFKIRDPQAYAYANIKTGAAWNWTVGASYNDFEQGTLHETSFNPKLGVQWQVAKGVRLRAAAFQIIKPALANDRTLEPTQIAGFNQFFDDINGTKSRRYAVGLDWQVTPSLASGAEFTWRKLEVPTQLSAGWVFENQDEQYHRLYLYWTPTDRVAVHTDLSYDLYRDRGTISTSAKTPQEVKTISLPLGVRYFTPSGWFIGATGTLVQQRVVRAPGSQLASAAGRDSFFIVNTAIGYRLPKRRGIFSVGVKNLFNRSFEYQDNSYREASQIPTIGPYFPTRTILGRFAVTF